MEYKRFTTPLLIEKCASNDALAWAEFVNRFSPIIGFAIKKALMKYSSASAVSEEDIKDIRQNMLAHLWSGNKLSEVRNRDNINYWLAISARNAAINYLKARRKEILMRDESFFEKIPAAIVEREIGAASPEELAKKIEKIYFSLSPREKIIFKLYFEKELSMKDISKIMRLATGTVSSAISRMRQKIKCSKI